MTLSAFFDKAVNGDLDTLLRFFETAEKTDDTAAGKAPTCTENGLTDGIVCDVCGETIKAQSEIAATGHHYGDDGVCTECGEKKPEQSKNFFRKIADFFRKIVNWFKNLFKRG